jgi:hypothetical protein
LRGVRREALGKEAPVAKTWRVMPALLRGWTAAVLAGAMIVLAIIEEA